MSGSSGQGMAAKAPTRLLLWQGRCIGRVAGSAYLSVGQANRTIQQSKSRCTSHLLLFWSDVSISHKVLWS